jgi:hypothetical protein
VTGAVVGVRAEAEIRANVAALTAPPPPGLWAELPSEGLLAADVPTRDSSGEPEQIRLERMRNACDW